MADQPPIGIVLGGQGLSDDPLRELRSLFEANPEITSCFLEQLTPSFRNVALGCQHLLASGLQILSWVTDLDHAPTTMGFASTATSMPLIGLLQLARFFVLCKGEQLHPRELHKRVQGYGGHSQGLIVAVALSACTDWASFYHYSAVAFMLLLAIGCRVDQAWTHDYVSAEATQEAVQYMLGHPSPMLSVSDVSEDWLEEHVSFVNATLPKSAKIHLSLKNSHSSLVASGPSASLFLLSRHLSRLNNSVAEDQSHTIFHRRQRRCVSTFLPVKAPFHSPHLSSCLPALVADLSSLQIAPSALQRPVYEYVKGTDLRHNSTTDLVPLLVSMITVEHVNWPSVAHCMGPGHILDLGPGDPHGIGSFLAKVWQGTATTVLTMGSGNQTLSARPSTRTFGSFRPTVCTSRGRDLLQTRFTKAFGLPPILAAGMTPTTCAWEFVAAIMNAGYYSELAGGGLFQPEALREAILNLADAIQPGRMITVNVIYANPRILNAQVSVVKELIQQGVPVGGLVFGAGVPSLETATKYIETLGLCYIGFKPGTQQSIDDVLAIAKAHPYFPIILQWTGGRAGGHHSYEDIHEPLLDSYAAIRTCSNVSLVIGSGFGDPHGAWEYLSGEWAVTRLGRKALMPVDGILLGTALMTTAEAKTSPSVKEAIVAAPGVEDELWTRSFSQPTGGIINVTSELGEAMHVISNRGMMLWSELDQKLFKLPKPKRNSFIEANKAWIKQRLNSDFQKVWFATDEATGTAEELEDWTYLQVLKRLLSLFKTRSQDTWLHPDYQFLFWQFILRIEERFDMDVEGAWLPRGAAPLGLMQAINQSPSLQEVLHEEFLHYEDVLYLIEICTAHGKKPVPFIIALDEDFETRFKKDSIWQAEAVDLIYHGDADRVCILAGPVAIRYCTTVNQPVGEVLDNIHNGCIQRCRNLGLQLDGDDTAAIELRHTLIVDLSLDSICVAVPQDGRFPTEDEWFSALAHYAAATPIKALCQARRVFQRDNRKTKPNPFRFIFGPRRNIEVVITTAPPSLTLFDTNVKHAIATLSAGPSHLKMSLLVPVGDGESLRLDSGVDFEFSHEESTPWAPIRERPSNRTSQIRSIYRQLWFGEENDRGCANTNIRENFDFGTHVVSLAEAESFERAIQQTATQPLIDPSKAMPIDFGIIVAWKALLHPVFLFECNLSLLLHLSNEFEIASGSRGLVAGEQVQVQSNVRRVARQEAGTSVTVQAIISRDQEELIKVTSEYLLREYFAPDARCFEREKRRKCKVDIKSVMHAKILCDQDWFTRCVTSDSIQGLILFDVAQEVLFSQDKGLIRKITGSAHSRSSSEGAVLIGTIDVEMSAASSKNPVLDFLSRNGAETDELVLLPTPVLVPGSAAECGDVQMPGSSQEYSTASRDTNPIHTMPAFARFAGLDGCICHGMNTSALVLRFFQKRVVRKGERLVKWKTSFRGMTRVNDRLRVDVRLIGHERGSRAFLFEAVQLDSDEVVLSGEATVAPPDTVYLFTGQGSQKKGMGMELAKSSGAARAVWNRADEFFSSQYGFRISYIAREDPKSLQISFRGPQGAVVRQNYLKIKAMAFEAGSATTGAAFAHLGPSSRSLTFDSADGLLSMTMFVQPAVCIMEKAAFEHLQSLGYVPRNAKIAGHSLGEFGALFSATTAFSFDKLLYTAFCRGSIMQTAVERDEQGRSSYGMSALDPLRVCSGFGGPQAEDLVRLLARETGLLLELVNFNVEGRQYVCAGDKRCLWLLRQVTDRLTPASVQHRDATVELVRQLMASLPPTASSLVLERGRATVPLSGIDVPFHSSHLARFKHGFRSILLDLIDSDTFDPAELVGKWVPNVTGEPFQVSRDQVDQVARLTGSAELQRHVASWSL